MRASRIAAVVFVVFLFHSGCILPFGDDGAKKPAEESTWEPAPDGTIISWSSYAYEPGDQAYDDGQAGLSDRQYRNIGGTWFRLFPPKTGTYISENADGTLDTVVVVLIPDSLYRPIQERSLHFAIANWCHCRGSPHAGRAIRTAISQ